MEQSIILKISFLEFKEKFEKQISEGIEFRDSKFSSSNDLPIFESYCNRWNEQNLKLFEEYLSPKNNKFYKYYSNAKKSIFKIANQQQNVQNLYKHIRSDIRIKIDTLETIINLIKVSDIILSPDGKLIEQRKNFTTREKLDLILKKLNQIYDDKYYSLEDILTGNGFIY